MYIKITDMKKMAKIWKSGQIWAKLKEHRNSKTLRNCVETTVVIKYMTPKHLDHVDMALKKIPCSCFYYHSRLISGLFH